MAGHSGLLCLWRCRGVNNITCAEWAPVGKIDAQEAGGRQERRGVGSGAEPSTLMLSLWHLGKRWLQGPSGDNSQDQRPMALAEVVVMFLVVERKVPVSASLLCYFFSL